MVVPLVSVSTSFVCEMSVCRRRVTSYGGEQLFHLGIYDFVSTFAVSKCIDVLISGYREKCLPLMEWVMCTIIRDTSKQIKIKPLLLMVICREFGLSLFRN